MAGTVLGVGGATMIEAHLHRALRNGKISKDEQALLQTDYKVVRIGLIMTLLSGFGFLLLYKFTGETARMYSPIMWAKLVIIIFIGINTLMLQARTISLFWGAGLSFVSWWLAAIFGMFTTNQVVFDPLNIGGFWGQFLSLLVLYAILVVIFSFILHFIRKTASKAV